MCVCREIYKGYTLSKCLSIPDCTIPVSHRGSESANESVGKGAGQGAELCVSRATECRPTALNIRSDIHFLIMLFAVFQLWKLFNISMSTALWTQYSCLKLHKMA